MKRSTSAINSESKRRKIDTGLTNAEQLTRLITLPKAQVWFGHRMFTHAITTDWYDNIHKQVVPLMKPTYITVYDQVYEEKRRVLGFGNENVINSSYTYSGKTVASHQWQDAPILLDMKNAIMEKVRHVIPDLDDPNFVLVNWYRDGSDKLGAHSDDETDLVSGKPIISLSLGATRRFTFHSKSPTKKIAEVMLGAGSICIMGENCQKYYKHAIPPMKKVSGDRFALTFRWINTE